MKIKLLFLAFAIILAFESCVTPRDTNFLQEDVRKPYDNHTTLNTADYRIIPGDRLVLTVYTLDEDLRRLFSMYTHRQITTQGAGTGENVQQPNVLNVYSDGTVKIPYLDRINVLDLSLLEAKNVIEEKFQEFSPNLTIELSLGNRYFSMLGAVSERRIAMPSPRLNIFQAMALGGIIEPFGDRRKVNIIRQTPHGTEVKEFDIRSADIVNSEYYYIQPNDVIYVKELNRTFFGRINSFYGIIGALGMVGATVATVIAVINWTK